MFSSAALLSEFECPFYQRGQCNRPFCKYQHVERAGSVSSISTRGFESYHATSSETPNTEDNNGVCLLELEKINKKIESVKCEVEKQQRKLSYYKTVGLEKDQYLTCPSVTKSQNKIAANELSLNKYVLGKSRPLTDLEYDPCSNFLSGLMSSGARPCKDTDTTLAKSEKRDGLRSKQMLKGCPNFDDSDDDEMLVIDIPSLEEPQGTEQAAQTRTTVGESAESPQKDIHEAKRCKDISDDCVPSEKKHLQIDEKCDKEPLKHPVKRSEGANIGSGRALQSFEKGREISCQAPARCMAQLAVPDVGLSATGEATEGDYSTSISHHEDKEKGADILNVLESLCACLDDLESHSETAGCTGEREPILKMNGSDPDADRQEDDLDLCSGYQELKVQIASLEMALGESSTSDKFSSPSAHAKHIQHTVNPEEQVHLPIKSASLPSVTKAPMGDQEIYSITNTHWARVQHFPNETYVPKPLAHSLGTEEGLGGGQCPLRSEGNTNALITSNPSQLYPPVKSSIDHDVQEATVASHAPSAAVPKGMGNGEPIVISSDSGGELNYSDFDLSESDPMEECYRIFMEGKEDENSSMQECSPVQADETAEADKIAEAGMKVNIDGTGKGQKNRIAHQPKSEETVGATFQLPANAHFILPQAHSGVPVIVPVLCPPQVLVPQPMQLTRAKPMPTKRKTKAKNEVEVKVPHNVRQRYVNLFVEEFLKTSSTVPEAFEKALMEEKAVYDRSVNRLKYLSVAVNALKKLRNQSTPSSTGKSGNMNATKECRGHIALKSSSLHGSGDSALYESLKGHILSDDLLMKNNYPLQHPDQAGCAVQYGEGRKTMNDAFKRICCRCGTTFNVNQAGKHTRKEECTYHHGRGVENKVPGGVESRYSCCEGAVGTAGCQVYKLHVHDTCSLSGFVSTLPARSTEQCCPGVYAIDCEMCYTTQGLELTRVTVVNSSLQVIYDAFVKPENEVIDYNTRFSGVAEKDVKCTSVCLKDVQNTLLNFINADTILIGHELDRDLCALKLLHSVVVDTSVSFPHRLGPPHKLELHHLTADYLRKIIQEGEDGRDTGENATACMQLMLWRVKEDAKVRKW
ncbi:hypothetical protein ACEWY4_027116 [Coilia grayii]|uniref:C3H1-type domain-containing protein n=1 Tax=Coilia grayii TaxID=363190 RepID=A0ABD1IRM0_9TELE